VSGSSPGLAICIAREPARGGDASTDAECLVAEGPQDSTVLVVGDVVGHGLQAARRASFIRTTFAAIAPFSDDPGRLLSWANTALIERAGTSVEFVTAACVTFLRARSSCVGPTRVILPRCGWMTATSSRR
jgi:hypothetical protein